MWFDQCVIDVQAEMQSIYSLPFIQQVGAGVLPRQSFDAYLAQDYLYLIDYSRALAYLAAKFTDCDHRDHMLALSAGCVQGEMAMHSTYLEQSAQSMVHPNSACQAYTDFLLRMTATEDAALGVAAILPCLWVYADIGKQLAIELPLDSHPFKAWIMLYAGDDFQISTQKTCELISQLALAATPGIQARMRDVFYRGVVLERLFWREILI